MSAIPPRHRSLLLAAMLFWTILVAWTTHSYVLQAPIVDGPSMQPTLADGQRKLLWMLPYRLRPPARGDIVAVDIPGGEGLIVKRVVALPGEEIQIRDGSVFVNGEALSEPYLAAGTHTPASRLKDHRYRVEGDCYFVLGDNRNDSVDSRWFGAVERQWIVGKMN